MGVGATLGAVDAAERLGVAATGVDDVHVRRDDDRLPAPVTGDAVVEGRRRGDVAEAFQIELAVVAHARHPLALGDSVTGLRRRWGGCGGDRGAVAAQLLGDLLLFLHDLVEVIVRGFQHGGSPWDAGFT